jgi:bifunctional NMN adenylyltransferase/nudix hydrolase
MFPQYSSIGVENLHDNLSATILRDNLFANKRWTGDLNHFVPTSTAAFLRDFSRTGAFGELLSEVEYYQDYRKAHEDAAKLIEERLGYKTDIKHQTVDAMVLCAGHVLLIERKNLPGRGLLALPGGFLDSGEWLDDAFIRELREETKIKVPSPVLRGNVFGTMVADYPYRSMRGRVISRVYGIKLPDGPLPEVKGRSDAKRAIWVPLAEVRPENMFEDHYHIIQHLKAQLKTAI